MLKNIKNVILFSIITSFSLTFAKPNDITFESELYEVVRKDNGEEIRFKTDIPKPQMTFEEEVVARNLHESKKYINLVYVKEIPKGFRFIKHVKRKNVFALYSSDGINYKESLNKDTDLFIKLNISEIKPLSDEIIKFRYTRSSYKGYND